MIKTFTIAYIKAIADAIREKNGTTNKYKVSDMPAAILDIQGGSDLILLMTGSEAFNFDEETTPTAATAIPAYMFYNNQNIRNINYDTIATIGNYAFRDSKVNKIILPGCTSLGNYAFYGCGQLSGAEIDLSGCVTIGTNAFQNCNLSSAIGSIDLSSVKSIGSRAFQDSGFFKGSSNEKVLNLPLCETIGDMGFDATVTTWSNRFAEINLPAIKTMGEMIFRRGNITTIKIGENCTSISDLIFYSCHVTNLYCYATTPPTLSYNLTEDSNNINHIYVPADSVNLYKSAQYWSNLSSKIEAIPA